MPPRPRPRPGGITRPSVWAHLRDRDPAAADGIAALARYWRVGRAPLAAALLATLWDWHQAVAEATAAQVAEAALIRHHPRIYRQELAAARARIARSIAACRADGLTDPDAIAARVRTELPPPGCADWATLAWRHAIQECQAACRHQAAATPTPAQAS